MTILCVTRHQRGVFTTIMTNTTRNCATCNAIFTVKSTMMSKRHQSTVSANTTVVHSFKELEPLARKFVLRVHPDRIHQYADEHVKINQRNLAEFMDVIEKLRTLSKPVDFTKFTISDFTHMKQIYRFQFYFEQKRNRSTSSSGNLELQHMKHRLIIPSDLLYTTQKALQQEKDAKNQGNWLALSCRFMNDILRHIGVDADVELSDELKETLKEKEYRRHHGKSSPRYAHKKQPSAEDLLRHNIQQMSPIVQGKSHGFQDITMHQASVFTEKQRNAAVGNYITRRVRFEFVQAADKPAALGRLTNAMVNYFDSLQLFNGAWGTINLVLSASYDFFEETNTLYIPHNFRDREFVKYAKKVLSRVENNLRDNPHEEVAKARSSIRKARRSKELSGFVDKVRGMEF